jgi:hypothetical protein
MLEEPINMEWIFNIELPDDHPVDAIRTKIRLWGKRIDDYALQETTLREYI